MNFIFILKLLSPSRENTHKYEIKTKINTEIKTKQLILEVRKEKKKISSDGQWLTEKVASKDVDVDRFHRRRPKPQCLVLLRIS